MPGGRNHQEGLCKDLLMKLDRETPGAKERMFHAIVTGNIYDWVDPKITDTRKN